MKIPVVGFAGFSGSGKTTLVEKLIPVLQERGLCLCVVKHDGHRYDIDRAGTDSYRFSAAGAQQIILTDDAHTTVIEQRKLTLEDVLARVRDVDLVLVEGYKNAPISRIGISRGDIPLAHAAQTYLAVVAPVPVEGAARWFTPEDIGPLADFIRIVIPEVIHFDTQQRIFVATEGR